VLGDSKATSLPATVSLVVVVADVETPLWFQLLLWQLCSQKPETPNSKHRSYWRVCPRCFSQRPNPCSRHTCW
jgi:hypothetical protein